MRILIVSIVLALAGCTTTQWAPHEKALHAECMNGFERRGVYEVSDGLESDPVPVAMYCADKVQQRRQVVAQASRAVI